jgi:hypothetical protein
MEGRMQIRKTYQDVKPELLIDELRDLFVKQGVSVGEAKTETYTLPTDTSSFITRGTLTFDCPGSTGDDAKECIRLHIVGSAGGETKVMMDIEESLFPKEKLAAFQGDLDFMLGAYEKR